MKLPEVTVSVSAIFEGQPIGLACKFTDVELGPVLKQVVSESAAMAIEDIELKVADTIK